MLFVECFDAKLPYARQRSDSLLEVVGRRRKLFRSSEPHRCEPESGKGRTSFGSGSSRIWPWKSRKSAENENIYLIFKMFFNDLMKIHDLKIVNLKTQINSLKIKLVKK